MFKKNKNIVLIRVCIGCILPKNAKLIGQGTYPYMSTKGKINEQYYDYEINEKDLDNFLDINEELLIKYDLLEKEKGKNEEDDNPVKPTTTRGWSKKTY